MGTSQGCVGRRPEKVVEFDSEPISELAEGAKFGHHLFLCLSAKNARFSIFKWPNKEYFVTHENEMKFRC